MSYLKQAGPGRTTLAALAAGALLAGGLATAGPVSAAPPSTPKAEKFDKSVKHDLRSPMQKKQDALKNRALEQVIAGKATPTGKNKRTMPQARLRNALKELQKKTARFLSWQRLSLRARYLAQ